MKSGFEWERRLGLDEQPTKLSSMWVRNLRQFFNASQEDFSDLAGVNLREICMWETARFSPGFPPIVRMLGMELAMLSKEDGKPETSLLGAIVKVLATSELPEVNEGLAKLLDYAVASRPQKAA